eukprot:TRINITY_DN19178_c0_g1::TRINITY_DN19178_c0_g1_i1::g.2245::m.2245 TRINITY_DN19178_c0_g1::TRINITY_DN19178_c0_g1_i1::g.2245  ORF type:complete len:211 (+),score=31.35,sp/Q5ZHP8/METL2_CHICK/47.12/8e-48,Methyltransf_23/PF13489.1/5.3e-18,Methyltransf_12/PF08242.7/1.8e-09,Methyltransf_31/PF13847.1/5.5e-08,Methyltransf_25/PF13649.1/3.5e-06,Methyltransf_25/PF13649.1/1.3e+03,Methyltransf_11/PF08241.7/3e-05,Methyltransf_26/PF13659.1/2.5e-05,Methyltransf_18/PF12847.2/0.0002,DUF3419/PF11899.3/0.012,CMAS/PF023
MFALLSQYQTALSQIKDKPENQMAFRLYGIDFAKTAVDLVKNNPRFDPSICSAAVCDVARDELPSDLPAGKLDFIMLIFVLSAVPPTMMKSVIQKLSAALKPGGMILFRDYGLYDLSQLRFKEGHRVENRQYVRGDGTLTYFFTTEDIAELAHDAGLNVVESKYCTVKLVNRKRALEMHRV